MDMLLPILVLITSFFFMMLINTPIAVCIGLSTFLTVIATTADTVTSPSVVIVAQRLAVGMESFSMLAIPMFIISGMLLGRGGMARRLMEFAAVLLKKLPGGLALSNILACAMFGTISGSAAAAVSSIGGCMIPEMNKKNYPKEVSVAVTITAATTGLLIPPSNIMIVYAMAAGGLVSVNGLFLGGILPGALMGLMLMIVAMIMAVIKGYGKMVENDQEVNISEPKLFHAFVDALPGIMIGAVVLVGILLGWFTATEASAISVMLSFFFAVFVYKEVKIKDLFSIFLDSGVTSAIVLLLIGTSSALSWVLTFFDIPQTISAAVLGVSSNPITVLLTINIMLLCVGVFMDMTPAVLIFTPILLPVTQVIGIDPLHFGIIMIANLCVGLCTPPVGTCLFVGCSVGNTRLQETAIAMIPYMLAMVVALLFITFIPELSLFIPSLMK